MQGQTEMGWGSWDEQEKRPVQHERDALSVMEQICEGLGQVCEKVWGSVEGLGAQEMGR